MRCGYCKKDIPEGSALCPNCGGPQPTPAERKRGQLKGIAFVIVAIAIFLLWTHYVGPVGFGASGR
jgi:predicted amidophosphoribosyltransferase